MRERLSTRRMVWKFQRQWLLAYSLPDIAHHDHTCMHPQPYRHSVRRRQRQPRVERNDDGSNFETGVNRFQKLRTVEQVDGYAVIAANSKRT